MKKVCQDYHSSENHPFYLFGPFWADYDITEGSFEILMSLIGLIRTKRHPENIESLQKPWNKCVKAAIFFEKTLFTLLALFWAAFDFDYGFFEVFTVSDLFLKLPMHVRSLEQL